MSTNYILPKDTSVKVSGMLIAAHKPMARLFSSEVVLDIDAACFAAIKDEMANFKFRY